VPVASHLGLFPPLPPSVVSQVILLGPGWSGKPVASLSGQQADSVWGKSWKPVPGRKQRTYCYGSLRLLTPLQWLMVKQTFTGGDPGNERGTDWLHGISRGSVESESQSQCEGWMDADCASLFTPRPISRRCKFRGSRGFHPPLPNCWLTAHL
jgi:hypothetical protein